MSTATYTFIFECELCDAKAEVKAEGFDFPSHPDGWQERTVDGEVIELCPRCAAEDDDEIRYRLYADDDEDEEDV